MIIKKVINCVIVAGFLRLFLCLNFCNITFANGVQTQRLPLIDVVYHGSTNRDIIIFEPRSEHVRDKAEGAVVFATPSAMLASCYLFYWDDSWVHQSISWKDNNEADYEIYMIIFDRERFMQTSNSGGAIYLLPASSFSFDKNKGLGIYEWTSKEKITHIAKIYFSSALEAMKIFGVKVYFLNEEQWNNYIALQGEECQQFLAKFKQY